MLISLHVEDARCLCSALDERCEPAGGRAVAYQFREDFAERIPGLVGSFQVHLDACVGECASACRVSPRLIGVECAVVGVTAKGGGQDLGESDRIGEADVEC